MQDCVMLVARVVLVGLLCCRTACVPLEQFFPYGTGNGDRDLRLGVSQSAKVSLQDPLEILGQQFSFFYVSNSPSSMQVNSNAPWYFITQVNSNGVLSFREPFTNITLVPPADINITLNEALVLPFWSFVDPGVAGAIYYQVVTTANDSRVLQLELLLQDLFGFPFNPTSLHVITWDRVAHYTGPSTFVSQ